MAKWLQVELPCPVEWADWEAREELVGSVAMWDRWAYSLLPFHSSRLHAVAALHPSAELESPSS